MLIVKEILTKKYGRPTYKEILPYSLTERKGLRACPSFPKQESFSDLPSTGEGAFQK